MKKHLPISNGSACQNFRPVFNKLFEVKGVIL